MAKWFKFDLLEIPSDLWGMLRDAFNLHASPKEAPPSTRKIPVGIVSILDNATPIGCFSPDLYEMAKRGYLRCQREQNDPAEIINGRKPPYITLNRADGTPKTLFELAVLPITWADNDPQAIKKIRKIIEDEFYSLKQNRINLPPLEYKFQIASDYLRFLPEKTGLKANVARDLELTLQNPADETPIHERVFHYLAQRSAMILTLVAALLIIPTTASYLPLALAGAVLANWCAKEFFTYDLVETLMRDIKSMGYSSGQPISLKKTLKTAILMSALLATAAAVGYGAWYETLALPFFAAKSGILMGAHYALTGFVTFFAAAGTLVGGTVAQRFFWGLGIKYKQISFEGDISKDKPLPDLSERQALDGLQMRHKLRQWEHKTLHKYPGLNDDAVAKIQQIFSDLAKIMDLKSEVTAGGPDAVANAATEPAPAPVLVAATLDAEAAAPVSSATTVPASEMKDPANDDETNPAIKAAL